MLAASAARFSADRKLAFEVLALGPIAGLDPAIPQRSLAGSQAGLAREVWRRQLAADQPALLFDLLGPARLQAWLPRPWRSPYAIALLGIEVWQPLGWSRRRALLGADRRLAISRYTLEHAQPFLPPRLGPTAVIHPVIEERSAAGSPDTALLAGLGEGFVLIVGRMAASERYKGHDELLAAWGAVQQRQPSARLVVVGDGDDRLRLAAKAAELGLGASVTFTGFVSEATRSELYRRAALLALVSRGEGFGLVYLEAMRAGKPCIAARDSAAAEVVADGQTGLLVPAGEPGELAAAIVTLLADPGRRQALGEAGRRRYAEHSSPARFDAELWPHLAAITGAS